MTKRFPIDFSPRFVVTILLWTICILLLGTPCATAQEPAGEPFPGVDGFLGSRASIMLDVVFLAMFLVVPVMGVGIYLVKYKRKYELHKTIMLSLGVTLLIAVTAFEVDMQFLTDWEARAEPSPYFDSEAKWSSIAGISLLVHLLFAIPAALIWIITIVQALRMFPNPPYPNHYSPHHIIWARIAAITMTMTAITGWVFYYLAFVAQS